MESILNIGLIAIFSYVIFKQIYIRGCLKFIKQNIFYVEIVNNISEKP